MGCLFISFRGINGKLVYDLLFCLCFIHTSFLILYAYNKKLKYKLIARSIIFQQCHPPLSRTRFKMNGCSTCKQQSCPPGHCLNAAATSVRMCARCHSRPCNPAFPGTRWCSNRCRHGTPATVIVVAVPSGAAPLWTLRRY